MLSVSGNNVIQWANEGGGCVVPLPPVVYKGKKLAAERVRKDVFERSSYELFGVDSRCNYYGTYRCIKVATMSWADLTSSGREFTDVFLDGTVVHDGHAAPVIKTLMRGMYETGILPAGCAVLRFEGFNNEIVEEMRSAGGPSVIRNMIIQNDGKRRPDADDDDEEGSQGPKKKLKFGSDHVGPQERIRSTGSKSRK